MANELTAEAPSDNLPYTIRPQLGAMSMQPVFLLIFVVFFLMPYLFSPELIRQNLGFFLVLVSMIPAVLWYIWRKYTKRTFRLIVLSDTGIDVEQRNGKHVHLTWKQIDSVEDPAGEDTCWSLSSGNSVVTIRKDGIVPADWKKLSDVIKISMLPELAKARPEPVSSSLPMESRDATCAESGYSIKPSRPLTFVVVMAFTLGYALIFYIYEASKPTAYLAGAAGAMIAGLFGGFAGLLSYLQISPRSIHINDQGISIEGFRGKANFIPWEYIKSIETGLPCFYRLQAKHRSFSLFKYVLSADDRDRLVRDVNIRRRAYSHSKSG